MHQHNVGAFNSKVLGYMIFSVLDDASPHTWLLQCVCYVDVVAAHHSSYMEYVQLQRNTLNIYTVLCIFVGDPFIAYLK